MMFYAINSNLKHENNFWYVVVCSRNYFRPQLRSLIGNFYVSFHQIPVMVCLQVDYA